MPVLEQTTSTIQQRIIARCSVKTCRRTVSALVEKDVEYTVSQDPAGIYRESRTVAVRVLEGPFEVSPWYGATPAVACHGSWIVKPVEGRYNPERKCDARCMGAVGPSCECSCGGKNHGMYHS